MSYVLLCKIVGNATLGKVVNWRTAVALPYAYDKVDKGEDNTGERNGSYNKHLWNNPPPPNRSVHDGVFWQVPQRRLTTPGYLFC